MQDDLKLNTKLFGFEGIIGRYDYLKNIIVISVIAFCFILPYIIWMFSNVQTSSDLYKLDEIFFEAPVFHKLLFITGLFLDFILSASNIIRRLNDINGEVNIFINTFVISLFGVVNFCFVTQLQLYYLFLAIGVILEIILLFTKGKITGSYPKDLMKEFNSETEQKTDISELSLKLKEKQDKILITLFFIAVPVFILCFLLFTSAHITDDTEKNNPSVSEQKRIDLLNHRDKKVFKENINNPKQEPDFAPYMKELQSEIKKNWTPPQGQDSSKRVVLLFSISKEGRLLNVKVKNSSGIKEIDDSAVKAVELTAPFKALPPEFNGRKVDIEFTFDYTVFGI